MSRIIFLNGCSSSGKTSISKAIQEVSNTPWLHVGVDTFICMLPSKFSEFGDLSSEGYYSFVRGENERGSCVQVKTGSMGEAFFHNHIPNVVKLLADFGHDIIVDEVIFDKFILDHYLHIIGDHRLHAVYVTCDFNVLQDRERLRGDRAIGLVNDQYDRLQSYAYDYEMTVDTTYVSAMENAQLILDAIK
jgi:chloramphenicol 3-O phosphotransferase